MSHFPSFKGEPGELGQPGERGPKGEPGTDVNNSTTTQIMT